MYVHSLFHLLLCIIAANLSTMPFGTIQDTALAVYTRAVQEVFKLVHTLIVLSLSWLLV